MLAKLLAVILLVEATLCQETEDSVRKLRFRRPRPKLIDVENPDGDLRGSPVELNLAESALTPSRPQSSGNAALEALIATAQREDPQPPQPQALEIEEVPTQRPLRAEQPEARPQRNRNRGNLNGVVRRPARPQGGERGEDRRRPNGPREDPVATLERYSHKNEDGSFTFGYVAADGSFREETRGVDCITRGKYGYIDPEGVKREYTYTSGLPCTGDEEDEASLQNLDGEISIEDPVDPKERFRQTVSEQLSEEQIPVAARPRRPVQRRPSPAQEKPAPAAPAAPASQFANFGANRAVVPERRPTPTRVAPRPRPAAPAAGSFDFDAELDGFTLNRPAIKFEANSAAAAANPNSFSSSIAFNQNTGTFQTSLQQNVQGGAALNLQNQAAPAGTTAAPLTTQPIRTTAQTFAPTPATPAPAAPKPVQTIPAGTVKLDFQPLNIPNIASVPAPEAPRSQPAAVPKPVVQAAPAPVRAAAPAPAPAAAPAQPANTFFVFQPFGQQGQPRPVSAPVPTPVNPNAFTINPVKTGVPPPKPQSAPAPAAPKPAQVALPQRIIPQPQIIQSQPRPVQPAPVSAPRPVQPAPASAPRPVQPAPASAPRPAPVAAAPRPVQSTPQLQFGFQPVSQGAPGQSRPAPFTAFRSGAPAASRPVQLGVPPQLQQQAQAAPQFAQFDSRFQPQSQPSQPQLRPAQFQPGAPQFSVFNPLQAFRGA